MEINIDSAIEQSMNMESISKHISTKCFDFGDCVLLKYQKDNETGLARDDAETAMSLVFALSMKGVNTPLYRDIKRIDDGQKNYCYVLQDKAKGRICSDFGANDFDEIMNIPQEHYDKLYKDIILLIQNGAGIEPKLHNIFYDKEKGFTIIDLCPELGERQSKGDINHEVIVEHYMPSFFLHMLFSLTKEQIDTLSRTEKIKQERACKNFLKELNKSRESEINQEDNNQGELYKFGITPVAMVMEQPEKYIIPECLDACRILWEKGIDTVQCGNYEDPIENGFWIEIDGNCLSNENGQIFNQLVNGKGGAFYEEGTHSMNIRVPRSLDAKERLSVIASLFQLQDTKKFCTGDEYLEGFKSEGGEPYIDSYGYLKYSSNPARKNATLDEALMTRGENDLYFKEEDRVYSDEHAINVHMNYLRQIKQNKAK